MGPSPGTGRLRDFTFLVRPMSLYFLCLLTFIPTQAGAGRPLRPDEPCHPSDPSAASRPGPRLLLIGLVLYCATTLNTHSLRGNNPLITHLRGYLQWVLVGFDDIKLVVMGD